jgi:hypothetical protein
MSRGYRDMLDRHLASQVGIPSESLMQCFALFNELREDMRGSCLHRCCSRLWIHQRSASSSGNRDVQSGDSLTGCVEMLTLAASSLVVDG